MARIDPDRERSDRFARRDRSAYALNDVERAERRHYLMQDYWRQLYLLAPLVIGAFATWILAGSWSLYVAIAGASVAAFAIAAALARVLSTHFRTGPALWFNLQALAHGAAGGLFALAGVFDSVDGVGASAAAMVSGAFVAVWPWLYRRLRLRYPSDYERYLAASQAPLRGMIE